MSAKILIVEDEHDFREGLIELLTLKGFEAAGVGTLSEYHTWVTQHTYDILILDRNLPDGDGVDILKNHQLLKGAGSVILSCEGQPEDRILGLNADADYYLVKPVQFNELLAILNRIVRRLESSAPASSAEWLLNIVRWQIITPDQQEMELTRSEFALMSCFVDKPGIVVNRDQIITGLGFNPKVYDARRLEVMLRRLRKKLEDAGIEKFPLQTVYGVGLVFNETLRVR
ncbi:response regulator transcription factor [Zwartia sp.]|uniref:response regulator transcription factor n=1 Tax=Zwartia sp. TaxID=2978004 RepID=UPI003BAFD2B5